MTHHHHKGQDASQLRDLFQAGARVRPCSVGRRVSVGPMPGMQPQSWTESRLSNARAGRPYRMPVGQISDGLCELSAYMSGAMEA